MIVKIKSVVMLFVFYVMIVIIGVGSLMLSGLAIRAGMQAQHSTNLVSRSADLVAHQMSVNPEEMMRHATGGNLMVYGIPVVLGGQDGSPEGCYISIINIGNSTFLNGFNEKHERILHRVLS